MKKIVTYTPITPEGVGPTSTDAKETIFEILSFMSDCAGDDFYSTQLYEAAEILAFVSEIRKYADGEYSFLHGYSIRVQTMTEEEFNNLPEFEGY